MKKEIYQLYNYFSLREEVQKRVFNEFKAERTEQILTRHLAGWWKPMLISLGFHITSISFRRAKNNLDDVFVAFNMTLPTLTNFFHKYGRKFTKHEKEYIEFIKKNITISNGEVKMSIDSLNYDKNLDDIVKNKIENILYDFKTSLQRKLNRELKRELKEKKIKANFIIFYYDCEGNYVLSPNGSNIDILSKKTIVKF